MASPTASPSPAPRTVRRRRRIALLVGICAPIALAILVAWLGRGAPAAPDPADGSGATDASDAPLVAGQLEAAETPREAPRPAASPTVEPAREDLPVLALIEQFDALAAAKDAALACRIVAELSRCRSLAGWNERAMDREIERLARQDLDEPTLEARSRDLADAIAYNAQAKHQCEGVTPEQLGRIPHYLLAAARAGHTPSMVQFASGHHLDLATLVADPQLYADYRAHAWPLFLRALQAGDAMAAMFWPTILPSGAMQSPLGGLVPDEWQTRGVALALAMRVQRELAPEMPTPEIDAPPSEADLAQADALFDRHYASSPQLDQWRAMLAQRKRDGERARRIEAQTQLCAVGFD